MTRGRILAPLNRYTKPPRTVKTNCREIIIDDLFRKHLSA